MSTNCPFYDKSLLGIGHQWELISFPSGSNRCALVTSAHSPCAMEIAGAAPEWKSCARNPEVNGIYRSVVQGDPS